MAITAEEVTNMCILLTMRASQAEAKVKQLDAELKALKEQHAKCQPVKSKNP